MEKLPKTAILVFIVLVVIGLVFGFFRGQQPKKVPTPGLPVTNNEASYALPAAKADVPRETSVGSPDGKWSLKMKEEKGKDETTYIFWTINLADSSQKEIFRKTVPTTTTLEVPLNSFSPDDKYIFLKETGLGEDHYLVLTTSGIPLAEGVLTVEISGLFMAKYPEYVISDVTGWGGVGLIVFNTDKKEGGTGPSFWFEVPALGFIRLSTRFN
jgi:hypothetical protein